MKKAPSKERSREKALTVYGTIVLVLLLGFSSLTLAFHASIASLLASATSSISGAPVVYFTPYSASESLTVGDTVDVDFNLDTSVPVNAVGATIQFPPDKLEIVGISKEKSFLNLWTEDTVIKEDTGELHFSGGTTKTGGVTGTSTILTISVRALQPGNAVLSVENIQVLAADGKGSQLDADARTLSFTIAAPAASSSAPAGGGAGVSAAPTPSGPERPSPDLNGDGVVNLVDVSIMIIKMFMPYNARFDLDMNGSVGISDLSVLLSKMSSP